MGDPTRLVSGRGSCGSYPRVQGGVSLARACFGDSGALEPCRRPLDGSPYCRTGAVVNRMTNGQQDFWVYVPLSVDRPCRKCMFPCPRISMFRQVRSLAAVDGLLMLCVSVYTRVTVTPLGDGLVMVGSLALLVRASAGQATRLVLLVPRWGYKETSARL